MKSWIPILTLIGTLGTLIFLIFGYLKSAITDLRTKIEDNNKRISNLNNGFIPREICDARHSEVRGRLDKGETQFKELNDNLQKIFQSITKIETIMGMMAKKNGISHE